MEAGEWHLRSNGWLFLGRITAPRQIRPEIEIAATRNPSRGAARCAPGPHDLNAKQICFFLFSGGLTSCATAYTTHSPHQNPLPTRASPTAPANHQAAARAGPAKHSTLRDSSK